MHTDCLFADKQVQLVIGNKNYSSWSMRGWLLLTKAGIDFHEISISFGDDDYQTQLARHSPSGPDPPAPACVRWNVSPSASSI